VGEFVRLDVDGGIGTIRLERPPMNALDAQVQDEIGECAREAAERRDVSAVIVYGGEKVFAAGADIKQMQAMTYTDMVDRSAALQSTLGAVARIPKPTVAAITGYALGGGLELALCCDFRVCGDNAKVGQPEILLGVIPGGGGTQRLARLVGPSRAKDLILTGRMVTADEALAIGLVDEVVPADAVFTRAMEYAGQFAKGPSAAYAAAKRAIDGGLDTDLRTGLDLEADLFAALFATDDQRIGMTSFVENGPGKAEFTGR
jgi:enoyl-CoA hydratase